MEHPKRAGRSDHGRAHHRRDTGLGMRAQDLTDAELTRRALDASGLSLRQFAREVLHGLRTEGAVRGWLRGGRMTASVRETLEGYLEQFRDAGQ